MYQRSRRIFLRDAFASTFLTAFGHSVLAQSTSVLHVASAGSVAPLLNGPVRAIVAEKLHSSMEVRSQGADAVARSLISGELQADVFIPITAGPMQSVLSAGLAETAVPIARTEMVLQYSPKSRFRAQFDDAAAARADWWKILQQPGLRIMRSDPTADPGGRNAIFVMQLAARKYQQADLVQKVLGDPLNPDQVLTGGTAQERFAAGEIDASFTYRTAPVFSHLPFVNLPMDVNLSLIDPGSSASDVSFSLHGKTYRPDPLVFYAATLKKAATPSLANEFIAWLTSEDGQKLLRNYQFAAATSVPELRA